MTILGSLAMFGLGLCLCAIAGMHGYRWGYRQGYDAGVEEGLLVNQRSEMDWWIQAEKAIDRERQNIWESET